MKIKKIKKIFETTTQSCFSPKKNNGTRRQSQFRICINNDAKTLLLNTRSCLVRETGQPNDAGEHGWWFIFRGQGRVYPLCRAYIGISHRGTLVGVHPTIPWQMFWVTTCCYAQYELLQNMFDYKARKRTRNPKSWWFVYIDGVWADTDTSLYPKPNSLHSPKLPARPWKMTVKKMTSLLGKPVFRDKLLVSGRVTIFKKKTSNLLLDQIWAVEVFPGW